MNIAIIFAQKAPPKAIAVFFSNQIGYFDVASEQKPLLHVWSLAVEEQFYIFWPLILLALNKKVGKKGTLLFCALLSCISLLYSEYLVHQAPTAAFYLLPSRAWELGLGALLAMFVNFGWLRRTPCYAGALASIVGIALICVAVFSFNEIMPFPGIAALVPCAGAGLVIAAGESRTTLGGRLLSLPPFALIGRISYSLYLWHWPTLVFAHLYLGRALRFDEKCWVLSLTAFAAYLSWRLVEESFRKIPVAASDADRQSATRSLLMSNCSRQSGRPRVNSRPVLAKMRRMDHLYLGPRIPIRALVVGRIIREDAIQWWQIARPVTHGARQFAIMRC